MSEKVYLLILILFACGANVQAQSDTTRQRKLLSSRIREVFHKAQPSRSDTLHKTQSSNNLDSLKNVVHGSDSSKERISTKDLSESDTLKKELPRLPGPSMRVDGNTQHSTDSLQRDVDELNAEAIKAQRYTQDKVDSIRERISKPVSNLKDKAETKIPTIAEKKIEVPATEQLQLPSIKNESPSLSSMNTSGIPPDIKTDISTTDALKLPSTDVKEVSNINLPQAADLDKVNDISDNLKSIDGTLGEPEKYEADLQSIKEGTPESMDKLSEQAEQKLTEIQEGTASEEITKATEEQAKYEAMIQRYRDRKLLEEEISRKYKAVANDYIMQQAGKVQGAQKQLELSKYKATRIKSVKDVFKKQSDELEEKKFYQRLVPGITWQIYTKDFVSADVSLQVGYRVTPRLTTGIGAIYRLGFDKQFDFFVKGLKTFGGRAYLDMTIVKGLFAHAEFEALKLHPTTNLNTNEAFSNKLYESYFGFGKRFNITRNVRGNVLGLYRVEHAGKLPAASKVSVRFGIDYVFRRPKKKLSGL
jgi:hypothetical protein